MSMRMFLCILCRLSSFVHCQRVSEHVGLLLPFFSLLLLLLAFFSSMALIEYARYRENRMKVGPFCSFALLPRFIQIGHRFERTLKQGQLILLDSLYI